MICPWMGQECPGPTNCAPAVMMAEADSENAPDEPVCPISSVAASLELVGFSVMPMVADMMKQVQPPPTRDEVIADLKIDQR